jgi:hypothetical protein
VEGCDLKGIDIAERRPAAFPPWTLLPPIVDTHLTSIMNKTDLPFLASSEVKIYYEKYSGQTHKYIYIQINLKTRTLAKYLHP